MKSAFFGVAFSLLAASANAAPGAELFQRAACNADNCLRQIRVSGSGRTPLPPVATADCLAFLGKAITPCAATTTTTKIVTESADAKTTTLTTTVLSTSVSVSVSASTKIVATSTELDISKTTSTTVVTTTTTVLSTARFTETEVHTTVTDGHFDGKDKRDAAVCTAVTAMASRVPTYASSCNAVRYSSACSCIGVTATTATVTLGQPGTQTMTSLSTMTVTPTVTVTVSATQIVTSVDGSVAIIPVTAVTTSTTTVTITTTTSATATQTISVCGKYYAQASSGTYKGSYIGTENFYQKFVADKSAAQVYEIRDGHVYRPKSDWVWNTYDHSLSLVYLDNEFFSNDQPMTCTLGAPIDSTGTAPLKCVSHLGLGVFMTCPTDAGYLFTADVVNTQNFCTLLDFVAVPACEKSD